MHRLDDLIDDTWVSEGTHVSQLIFFTRQNLSQNSSHDLARPSFWQIVDNNNTLRRSKRANRLSNLKDQFLGELRCSLDIVLQRDECVDRYKLGLSFWRLHCPVNSSAVPTTAASATPWYMTNAASISAVLNL